MKSQMDTFNKRKSFVNKMTEPGSDDTEKHMPTIAKEYLSGEDYETQWKTFGMKLNLQYGQITKKIEKLKFKEDDFNELRTRLMSNVAAPQ